MKLYGAAYSRAGRCIWMLEEIGQPYDHVGTSPRGETRTPQMLKLNPNGHVPVLDDNGYIIWESLAINQYLAEKTSTLWPAGAQARGQVAQWSLGAMTEVEPHLVTMLMHMMFLPEDQRSPYAPFTVSEREAREIIALAVAQANDCQYCLAAHSTIGKMVGLSPAAIESARRAEGLEEADRAVAQFADAVLRSRGRVDDEQLAAFRAAGFNDEAVAEVVAHIAMNVFTNYFNNLAETDIDFPAAAPLAGEVPTPVACSTGSCSV